ncbi:MAG: hypothetical protein C5B48_06490 [Candidatus Rokuibacteriota bacterium]|nr:MAG: hypothetical protein C5B48_06490 [Candidatus Rokubacteria bacterium]
MIAKRLAYSLATLIVLGSVYDAHAHGLIGKCFLPATLAIDDPFVADELTFPMVSHIKTPASGDSPATKETDLSAEFSKRLSPNLGISLGGTYKILDQEHAATLKGFDNFDVSLKYVFFKNPEHQTLISAGLGWEVGGSGSKTVGADSFDKVTPQLFWGKCLGDLPEALEFLQPLVFTGAFGVAIPTRSSTKIVTVDPDTGDIAIGKEQNPNVAQWGFTVQYDLYYLQSFVRDIGLRPPFNRMVPLVEFAMQTPLDRVKDAGRTTGTINPGIIWFGRYVQLGVEAQIPVNERTGKNVGILAQVHFYLDDIAPQIFTWTPFHGVLGPTFPR